MLDLAIRGGDVVAPQGTGRWSLGVKDGKIAFVGLEDQAVQAAKVIDATGKLVVPGGIESHTHLGDRITMQPSEAGLSHSVWKRTRAMAFGGTTTHVDFAWVHPQNDVTSAIERRMNRWNNKSHVDYTFHVALTGQLPLKTFDQLPEAIQQGFPSFKVFTADFLPPHPRRFPLRMDLGRIQLAMEKVAAHDGIMVVHAEDHDIVLFNYEPFQGRRPRRGLEHAPGPQQTFREPVIQTRDSEWLPRPALASTSSTPPVAMVSKP